MAGGRSEISQWRETQDTSTTGVRAAGADGSHHAGLLDT